MGGEVCTQISRRQLFSLRDLKRQCRDRTIAHLSVKTLVCTTPILHSGNCKWGRGWVGEVVSSNLSHEPWVGSCHHHGGFPHMIKADMSWKICCLLQGNMYYSYHSLFCTFVNWKFACNLITHMLSWSLICLSMWMALWLVVRINQFLWSPFMKMTLFHIYRYIWREVLFMVSVKYIYIFNVFHQVRGQEKTKDLNRVIK